MVTITGGMPTDRDGVTMEAAAKPAGPGPARWYRPLIVLALLVLALAGAAKGFWMVLRPDLPVVNAAPVKTLGGEERSGASRLGAGREPADYSSQRGPHLALVGIILPGYALISVDGRPQKAFTVGQEILSGLVLRVVYRDRVLVERAGSPEVLVLQDARGGSAPLLAPGAQPGGRMIPVPPVPLEVQEIGRNQYRVAREQVNAQMRNPDFLGDARLDPYPGGGFAVNGIRPDSVYEKLGLKTGDIIRTVNGEPVNSVADAVRLYQQLYQINQVRLGVVRGGRVIQLSYNLQ